MTLADANPSAQISGRGLVSARSHYIMGNDSTRWHTNVPHYEEVRYENVYTGIDLVFYGQEQVLEYDFIVAPRADPSSIRLAFDGELKIDAGGDLLIHTQHTEVRQSRPVAYQERNGVRGVVSAQYVLLGRQQVGLEVGSYDPTRTLVIDPKVVLAYSTYLGGLSTDVANSVALDSEGNIHVTGRTESDDFPTASPMQPVRRAGRDIFVTKMNEEGSLIYSTYIGGSGDENPIEVVVDQQGNAFVTGVTSSLDFPSANAFQPNYGGGPQDAFVLKLNSAGSDLIYATYLGGTGFDQARGIAIDSEGSAYVTGNTPGNGFPTKHSIQPYGGGVSDAFIAKLTPDGTDLVYSTLLGGSALESGRGIRLDEDGNAYVVGETRSTNFPVTTGAFQRTYGGGLDDLFVAKLNAAGTDLVFATYLGGSGADQGQSTIGGSSTIHGQIIAIDSSGNSYITGDTASLDFPLRNALQPHFGGGAQDAFVAKLTADGSDLIYSTYLGGSGFDTARSISVDRAGQAAVVGSTGSRDFPTANPLQPEHGGGDFDAFAAQLSADGTTLLYSTYLGGRGTDAAWGSTLGPNGKQLYVVGQTSSPDFPLRDPLQAIFGGTIDGFVCKLVRTGPPAR